MFALHETTSKLLCRAAFFACCVAPCAATAAWIASHRLPGRTGQAARELSATLDMHVKLADWRTPRPGMHRCSHVILSEQESGRGLAELAGVEWRRGAGVRVCAIAELTVDAAHREALGEKLRALLAELPPETHDVRIARITIKRSSEAGAAPRAFAQFQLDDVRGAVDRDAAGRLRGQFVARVAGSPPSSAPMVRLTMTPSKDPATAAPIITLETGPTPLPAWVLADFVPGFGRFGESARFTGAVEWTLDAAGVRGAAHGSVDGVDLAAIQPAGSPHRLEGIAGFGLDEWAWQGERMERLAGSIRSSGAQASPSLLAALVATFRCTLGGDVPPPGAGASRGDAGAMIALDELAVRFELDGRGLTFWGEGSSGAEGEPGCLAVSGGRPLVFGPRYRDWPLGALVQAFAAPSSAWLPATREAVDMAERLPLPLR